LSIQIAQVLTVLAMRKATQNSEKRKSKELRPAIDGWDRHIEMLATAFECKIFM
jgi:hypothetical protein